MLSNKAWDKIKRLGERRVVYGDCIDFNVGNITIAVVKTGFMWLNETLASDKTGKFIADLESITKIAKQIDTIIQEDK